jgi:hypothetical protein
LGANPNRCDRDALHIDGRPRPLCAGAHGENRSDQGLGKSPAGQAGLKEEFPLAFSASARTARHEMTIEAIRLNLSSCA